MPENPMDHRNDPIWQMGQQNPQQRIFEQHQAWANKEQYYQRQAANAVGQIPLKLGIALLRFVPYVFCVYVLPFIGGALAAALFALGLWIIRQYNGFFNLGLALGTIDVIIFLVATVVAGATLFGFGWALVKMTWFGKILAQFCFVYSLGVWAIHRWDAETGWKFGGAWFFCVTVSSVVEGIAFFMERRQAGKPATIF